MSFQIGDEIIFLNPIMKGHCSAYEYNSSKFIKHGSTQLFDGDYRAIIKGIKDLEEYPCGYKYYIEYTDFKKSRVCLLFKEESLKLKYKEVTTNEYLQSIKNKDYI